MSITTLFKPYESHSQMSLLWAGYFVMGLAYYLWLWDEAGSPAFIIGQIIMGALGMCREYHLSRMGFSKN